MVDTSPEPRSPLDDKADFGIGGWLWLVLGALVVGLLAGLLGGAFRAVLMHADHSRGVLIDRLHAHPAGWLLLMHVDGAAFRPGRIRQRRPGD